MSCCTEFLFSWFDCDGDFLYFATFFKKLKYNYQELMSRLPILYLSSKGKGVVYNLIPDKYKI